MKNPTTLFDCRTKLDAYYLKNIIQQITYVPVKIIRVKKHIYLIVDASNYPKVKVILDNQMHYLPSYINKNKITKQNNQLEEKLVQREWFPILNKLHHQLEVFSDNMASFNLHLVN